MDILVLVYYIYSQDGWGYVCINNNKLIARGEYDYDRDNEFVKCSIRRNKLKASRHTLRLTISARDYYINPAETRRSQIEKAVKLLYPESTIVDILEIN